MDAEMPAAVRALIEDPTFQEDADAAFRATVAVAEAWRAAVGPGGPGRSTPGRC